MVAMYTDTAIQESEAAEINVAALSTGVHLPYVEQGDPTGVPVVFLHGYTDSWRSYELALPFLPPSIHAFALTQRGHGDADRPTAGYATRDFAADVAAFLDSQELESAVIAGHSMGSSVALRFAQDFPERTRGLVLIGAFARYALNPAIVEFWETAVSSLEDPIDPAFVRAFQESTLGQPIPPAFLEAIIAESLQVPARVWRDAFAALLTDEHLSSPEDIQAPALLVWGDQDAFVPKMDQYQLLARLPDARLKIYDGIGHAIQWEAPERFATDVVDFVASLRARWRESIATALPPTRALVVHY